MAECLESTMVLMRRQCPNKEFCECNMETRKLECLCKQPDCSSRLTFANKSLVDFREIYINNVARLDHSLFANTQVAPQFRLSLQSTREIGSCFLADLVGGSITLLEIIYFDMVRIHARAFDGLKCETFSFISLGENTAMNLDAFGPDTRVNNLLLDFHSTSKMNAVFENTDSTWLEIENDAHIHLLTRERLIEYWSSRARIKKVYIQEVTNPFEALI